MSSSAEQVRIESPRRTLSDRQALTVQRLTDAAAEEVREAGYERLTVRSVARRAGVAAATAYTYFASKEHLLTEAYWRRVQALPDPRVDLDRPIGECVTDALADFTQLSVDEPALVAACIPAMLVDDPDVKRIRDHVGAEIHRRLVAALGPDTDPVVLDALDLAMSGAMIRAGTGHLAYAEIPARMAEFACLLVRTGRGSGDG